MRRHIKIVGLIACLIVGVLISQTLSQTRGGFGQRPGFSRAGGGRGTSGGTSRSQKRRETDQTKEMSLKGAVGATDEQWVLIKPKLERVMQLCRKACLEIYTAGGGSGGSQRRGGSPQRPGMSGGSVAGGGSSGPMGSSRTPQSPSGSRTWMSWRWGRSWESEGPRRRDERLCDELSNMLENKAGSSEEIKQKTEELRRARNETLKMLATAQEELRKIVTLDQECRLLALGWLD